MQTATVEQSAASDLAVSERGTMFEQSIRAEALRQLCALRERILEHITNHDSQENYWRKELRALDDFAASRGLKLT